MGQVLDGHTRPRSASREYTHAADSSGVWSRVGSTSAGSVDGGAAVPSLVEVGEQGFPARPAWAS